MDLAPRPPELPCHCAVGPPGIARLGEDGYGACEGCSHDRIPNVPSVLAGHAPLPTVECGAQGLLCGTLVDDGGGARADCGACSHELIEVVGDFEQIAADRLALDPQFFAVLVETPTRWLVLIEADGTVTRLLEIGERPIVSLLHRYQGGSTSLPVWMLDDQGTITTYEVRGRTLHRATADELGFRARALQWPNFGPVAELCDPTQPESCHLRGLLELHAEAPPTVRREIMMMEQDLVHASIGWQDQEVNETVCWALESDRRLRCMIEGTEVVWPPPASGVVSDAFRYAERRGLQIIDNTCTVYDIRSRDRVRVPGADEADCGAHKPFVMRNGCLVAVDVEESSRTRYRGVVCGVPDHVRQVAVSLGFAAVMYSGATPGSVTLVRSNLFDILASESLDPRRERW